METVMWDCVQIRYSEKCLAQILKSIDRLCAVAYFVHFQVHSHSHKCLVTCSCLSARARVCVCVCVCVCMYWHCATSLDPYKNMRCQEFWQKADAYFITWLHLHDTFMSSYVSRIYLLSFIYTNLCTFSYKYVLVF